jgi:hypothetical protein
MARKKPKTHKDVEFEVEFAGPRGGRSQTHRSFEEAAATAIAMAASTGQEVYLDVLIYSKAGARWWGGEAAVEMYEEDPDASVSQRVIVRAEDEGRIA